ncbi:DUF1499 domain-containing protein [Falsirhodobacter deserti]|uniref:DUF1499 domain-containing protein n=1 Tax=Falsirhodobacter deserti TaxID=1365611 RepID=UPI000FE32BB8|nr:DUF1499 domain-containing protein [Falsirhodobacter deserti]
MSLADFLILLLVALLVIWAFLRYTPSDSQDWHVDPMTVRKPSRPNHLLLRDDGPLLPLPPHQVAARLEAVARHTPRTKMFAGEGFHRTWITRSAVLGLPTFTSVRLIPDGQGTRVTVHARARYLPRLPQAERSRVESWLEELRNITQPTGADGVPPAPPHAS